MATYSGGRVYIQTFAVTRNTNAAIGATGLNTIYTCPADTEAEVEIYFLRISTHSSPTGERTIGYVRDGVNGSAKALLSTTTPSTILQYGHTFFGIPGTTQPGDLAQVGTNQAQYQVTPYKITLLEGDGLTFLNTAGSVNDTVQWDIIVREWRKA